MCRHEGLGPDAFVRHLRSPFRRRLTGKHKNHAQCEKKQKTKKEEKLARFIEKTQRQKLAFYLVKKKVENRRSTGKPTNNHNIARGLISTESRKKKDSPQRHTAIEKKIAPASTPKTITTKSQSTGRRVCLQRPILRQSYRSVHDKKIHIYICIYT